MPNSLKFETPANDKSIAKVFAPTFRQELFDYFVYFVKVFIAVMVVYLFIRTVLFDAIAIEGKSMFPNYDNKDAVYIDQLTPRFGDYRRGDVVVLLAPESINQGNSLFIKRIIGLPGERVVLEDGVVYIYSDKYSGGIELNELDYLRTGTKTYKNVISNSERYEERKLGEDEYYVIGDNRTGSTDSRSFGPVKKSSILGREFYRIVPESKAGFFNSPRYNIEH